MSRHKLQSPEAAGDAMLEFERMPVPPACGEGECPNISSVDLSGLEIGGTC